MFNKSIAGALLISAWILNSCVIHAQVVEEWVARFNGFNGYGDRAYAIANDSSGYLYVTGSSWIDTLEGDCATVKYDSDGNEIWVAWYDGQLGFDYDYGIDITLDHVGNVYVTGESRDTGTGVDFFTVKYDSSGNEYWSARYNGLGDSTDVPSALAVDTVGNVYVTGYSWGHPDSFSDYDWAIVKYDSMGDEQWVSKYNGIGNYNDYPYDIEVDPEGNVYVTGSSADLSLSSDATTIKYDSSGFEVWSVVEDFRMDDGYSLVLDSSGNPYVAGSLWPGDVGIIKYNKIDGTELKLFQYDDNTIEDALYIVLDSWGNIIVAGGIYRALTNWDYITVKFDTSGNTVWAAEWNGTGDDDFIRGLSVDPMGNVAVTGKATIFGNDFKDNYATVKYDSSGNEVWSAIYNGPADADDESNGIVMDASGNVYVTGFSDAGPPTGYDYTTIKYSDLTGVEEKNSHCKT
jgi:hypothetical protein